MILEAKIKNIRKVEHIVIALEAESLELLEKVLGVLWSALMQGHSFEDRLGIRSPGEVKLGYRWYALHWPDPKRAIAAIVSEIRKNGKFDLPAGEVRFTFMAKPNPELAKLQVRRKHGSAEDNQ